MKDSDTFQSLEVFLLPPSAKEKEPGSIYTNNTVDSGHSFSG